MRCPHENTAIKYEFGTPPSTAVTVITYCKNCNTEIDRHIYKRNEQPAHAPAAAIKS